MVPSLTQTARHVGVVLVVSMLSTAVLGCDARSASWSFTFAEDSLKQRAVIVEARILDGSCGGSRVLYETSIDPDSTASSPEELAPGTYGFFGRAADADCRWFAEGCLERTLPMDEEAIAVRLLEIQPQLYCYTGTCNNGRCTDEADAGPDADADGEVEIEADIDEPEEEADAPPRPPSVPRPLLPMNGWTTGSCWATNSRPNHRPRRPTFVWREVDEAQSYELQIDDSCPTTAFDSCEFPSPELSEVIMASFGTSFTPVSSLAIETTVPVGTRYFWRIRACNGAGCSDWSSTRYIDVGRLLNDFNGDGYSDAAISSLDFSDTRDEEGAVFVFNGSAEGLSSEGRLLSGPAPQEDGHLGASLAAAGDLNADGFADIVVSSSVLELAIVFLGGEEGPVSADGIIIQGEEGSDFGFDVAGAGDVNADGFADIIIGAQSSGGPEGQAFVYSGSSEGIVPTPLSTLELGGSGQLGHDVAGVGDVNGDGFADVLVGAYLSLPAGQAMVFNGGPEGPGSLPSTVLDNPLSVAGGRFGIVVSPAGDVNGDGFSDLLVGDYLRTETLEEEGAVFLFIGRNNGIDPECSQVIYSPNPEESGFFGWRIASAGDVDRDGHGDVLIGASREQSDVTADNAGRAYLFLGSASELTHEITFDNPDELQMNAGFGLALANGGDVDGDGWSDILIGAPLQNEARGHAFLYAASDGAPLAIPTLTIESPTPQPGAQFAFTLETGLAP